MEVKIPEFLDNDTFFAILPQYFTTTDLNQTIKMCLNWQDFSFNSSSFTNCINSLGIRDVFILFFFFKLFLITIFRGSKVIGQLNVNQYNGQMRSLPSLARCRWK